jgi:hypothetical protein
MFARPESEAKTALLPEIVAVMTVPDDPTRTHSVAVGHETAWKSFDVPDVTEVVVQLDPLRVANSALPPVPTAKHVDADPQAIALGFPVLGIVPVAVAHEPPAFEVTSTCQGFARPPTPPHVEVPSWHELYNR